jgi:hypothetical protein
MPRYELRNTANNAKLYVDGANPLELTGLVPDATYRASVMSAESSDIVVAAAFHPSQLFTSGRDGFAIIPSLTTSFESADDSDAAEVGDGVRFQKDSSGLASPRDFSQATSGRRPLLALDSALYSLDFEENTSDHRMSTPAFEIFGGGGLSFFARINVESTSGSVSRGIMGADNETTQRYVQFRTGFSPQQAVGIGAWTNSNNPFFVTSSATFTNGTWINVCGIVNTTNARIWLNTMTDAGVSGTTVNPNGTLKTGSRPMFLGNWEDLDPSSFDGKIAFAFCGNWSLSETERQQLADYATALG